MTPRASALLFLLAGSAVSQRCYYNAECPYSLFSTRTPYETIRGDIRDINNIKNCKPVSVWSFHRHGNRNPSKGVTENIKGILHFKDEILNAYHEGRGVMCAQDIENFNKWSWNDTIEESPQYLTGTGYEELYDIGKRLRLRFSHLLNATEDSFYFRPTDEQRTQISARAFINGLLEGTTLNLNFSEPLAIDNGIRPYKNCSKYDEIKSEGKMDMELKDWANSDEVLAVRDAVQKRTGITTKLTVDEVYAMYELCGFTRTWASNMRSPWCAVFSNEDLVVMEYKDDVRHYYSSGYGLQISTLLGEVIMKDLQTSFNDFVNGNGKNIISYFSHDTAIEMAFCALGLYKSRHPIVGKHRDAGRVWRTSLLSSFATNIIAVLNSCQVSEDLQYKVQIFVGEKETKLCPVDGCSWEEFNNIFKKFSVTNMDFCEDKATTAKQSNSASLPSSFLCLIVLGQLLVCYCKKVSIYIF